MKICSIGRDNLELFERFIPNDMHHLMNEEKHLFLGVFDETGTHAACVLSVVEGIAQIQSLRCDKYAYQEGFESDIVDIIVKNSQKLDVFQIQYIGAGNEEYLENLDCRMMDAGFFPSEGEVVKYTATLQTIKDSLGSLLQSVMKKFSRENLKRACDIDQKLMWKFNRHHPETAYSYDEYDNELSMFFVPNDEITSGIYVKKSEAGELVLSWMDFTEESSESDRMLLAIAAFNNACQIYKPDKKVVIYSFLAEVDRIIKRLGFTVDDSAEDKTHIYNYYIY